MLRNATRAVRWCKIDACIEETGFTALHVLASSCSAAMNAADITAIVDTLVDAGASVSALTPAGDTVMHLAAASCNAALVAALVAAQLRNRGEHKTAAACQIVAGGKATVLHYMARQMLPRLEVAMLAAQPQEAHEQAGTASALMAVPPPVSIMAAREAKAAATALAAAAVDSEV